MKTFIAAVCLVASLIAAPARAEDFALGAEAESGESQKSNTDTDLRFVKNRHGAVLYLMLGNNSLNLDSLNSRLSANGYSTIEKNFVMFGVGGHAVMDDWICGGEFHWMNQQKTSSGAYDLYVNGGYFLINGGYVVRRSDSYMIYPMAGIGLGTLSLNIQSTAAPTFDEALANPKSGTQLTHTSVVFNVAVAADGLSPVIHAGGSLHMPFTFGFRAGYLFSTPVGGWQSMEGNANGGPDLSFSGPYLQVIVGLGFMIG
ncbi:MAG: hypothetical protein EPO63_08775 [Candidatus Nitrosotenuis sp.]|nr:MAG: hypothetical protein EPO63_08775 [Candidatus Nitrosotenuis sp.]